MSLKPLDAAPAIPVHAFAAMAAFALGVVQIAAPKGTLPHRTLGWIWVVPMAVVAGSSFWIHQLRVLGPWSPIHLLSIFSAVMLVLGVWYARRHNVRGHDDDLDFRRRSDHRRPVRLHARADHACGAFRALNPLDFRGSGRASAEVYSGVSDRPVSL